MLATLALALFGSAPGAAPALDCAEFQRLVRATYDFRPSRLDAKQKEAKSARMDAFWKRVQGAPKELVPCLREALEAPDADAWFQVDGSALLVEADPSPASKELQARLWSAADLDDLEPEAWMRTLAGLGAQGFDVSEAARRWMREPHAFTVAAHALTVNLRYGARFLIGSMDEAQALAVLEPIAADPKSPVREVALDVIACLATPEALRALKRIGLEGCEEKTRRALEPLLGAWKAPSGRSPRGVTSRSSALAAMKAYAAGKPEKWAEIERSSEHWAAELLGALKAEDLALLRRVRRLRAACMSDEALDAYSELSGVLMALTWKPEYVQ